MAETDDALEAAAATLDRISLGIEEAPPELRQFPYGLMRYTATWLRSRRTPPSTAGWLPIATAPKKGRLDLWGISCVPWTGIPQSGARPQRWTGCDWDGEYWRCGGGTIKPTHWREPPPAPSQEGASEGEGGE